MDMRKDPLIPAGILIAVFLGLSCLHWYWALGGKRWFDGALPTKGGEKLFVPGKGATALVAIALAGLGVLVLWRTCPFSVGPIWVQRGGVWIIAAVFAARAVGDFRSFGLFKRIRDTDFAHNDTLFFTPLCAFISALSIWLALVT